MKLTRRFSFFCLAATMALTLVQVSYAKAPSVTSLFQDDWLKVVVSLELLHDPSMPQPIGTGFLVISPNRHILLCTAKHVILNAKGAPQETLAFRLNDQSGNSFLLRDSKLSELGLGTWYLDETEDLACRFIIRKTTSDIRAIPVDRFLSRDLVSVGTPLMVLGFPLGLRSSDYATPIARRAMVALNHHQNFIVDAFAFPGNSGGPVVYAPMAQSHQGDLNQVLLKQYLVGMVVSAITYVEKAVSEKTLRPRVTFEDNAGLSNIVSADAILRLIGREDVQALDQQLQQ